MNFRVLKMGSCLSGMTAALLAADHRWQRVADVDLQRSDLFCEHFVRRTAHLPPRPYLERLLAFAQDHGDEGRRVFDRMYWETLANGELRPPPPPLAETLAGAPVDAILLDNLHDTLSLRSRLYLPELGETIGLSFPLHWCRDLDALRPHLTFEPAMTAAASASCWAEIVRWLRGYQPSTPIFFLCMTGVTLVERPERQATAAAFPAALRQALGPAQADIHIVPPLRLPRELTKLPDDTEHFDMAVYRALAGHVVTTCLAR